MAIVAFEVTICLGLLLTIQLARRWKSSGGAALCGTLVAAGALWAVSAIAQSESPLAPPAPPTVVAAPTPDKPATNEPATDGTTTVPQKTPGLVED